MGHTVIVGITFGVYLVAMLAIGLIFYRRTESLSALFILVFFLIYTSSGFVAGAQGIIMLFAVIVVPVPGIVRLGGFSAFLSAVTAANPEMLTLFHDAQGAPLTGVAVVSSLAWGLGYFGQPHILARFMAVKSEREIAPGFFASVLAIITVSLLTPREASDRLLAV